MESGWWKYDQRQDCEEEEVDSNEYSKQEVFFFYDRRRSRFSPQSPHQTGRPPGEEGRHPRVAAGPQDLPGGTRSDTAWPTRPPLG